MWSNKKHSIRCHNNYYYYLQYFNNFQNRKKSPLLFLKIRQSRRNLSIKKEPIIASSQLLRVRLSNSCWFTNPPTLSATELMSTTDIYSVANKHLLLFLFSTVKVFSEWNCYVFPYPPQFFPPWKTLLMRSSVGAIWKKHENLEHGDKDT